MSDEIEIIPSINTVLYKLLEDNGLRVNILQKQFYLKYIKYLNINNV
jgi:hypothetical protein